MPKGNPSPQLPIEPSATAASPTADERPPLPPGWVWTTIGDICYPPQYGWTTKAAKEGNIKLLRTTDITSGSIHWESVPYCSEAPPAPEKYLLQDGDIVISRAGSVGFSMLIRNPPKAVFASYLIRFKPIRNRVDERYLYYYLQSPDYWQSISQTKLGIAIPNVNATKLRSIIIPLAPLPEQRRIVAKIEELSSQLDAAEEGLRRVQRNLKRYRAAVLKAAVEGRLVPTEAELARREGRPYETGAELLQRILAERRRKWEEQEWAKRVEKAKKKAAQARRKARGLPTRLKDIPPEEWETIPEEEYRRYLPKDDRWKQKYREPTPPDTASLPPLPEGWVWATVGQLGEVSGGITKNRKRTRLPIQLPYLRVANVYANELRLDDVARIGVEEQEIPKALLQKGDLLVVEGNGSIEQIGRVAIWDGRIEPCLHQNHIIKVRFILSESVHYTLYWLLSQEGRAQIMRVASSTSGLYTLSLSKVERLPVPLPPLAEQRRIVAEVERRLSVAREVEKAVEANLKRIARLRQAILKRAFEGKL